LTIGVCFGIVELARSQSLRRMLKMRKIMLFCAAGMSTSLLVSKMQKEAEARGINDLKIWAVSVSEYEREIGTVDVCLLDGDFPCFFSML